MRLLTIGIDRPGTTSCHRRIALERLLPDAEHCSIDTWAPFYRSGRLARSAAFRLQWGPAVAAINGHVRRALAATPEIFDLIWIDKAVFLRRQTVLELRARARLLVHYTPDTAFLGNRSRHYERSGDLYDLHVTTKSLEVGDYRDHFPRVPVQLTTQAYHEGVHRPEIPFEEKSDEVAFIGLAEPSRFLAVKSLLDAGIPVKLAGFGWQRFVSKNRHRRNLRFISESLSDHEYTDFLSSSHFALGLVSKRFPELHTTRTFEIPACGTALVTERNDETRNFFGEDEAIFFSNTREMIEQIQSLRTDPARLKALTNGGNARVVSDGRSYDRILRGILEHLGILTA